MRIIEANLRATDLTEQAYAIMDAEMQSSSTVEFSTERAVESNVSASLMGRVAFHDEYVQAAEHAVAALASLGEIDSNVMAEFTANWRLTMKSTIRRAKEVRGLFKAKTHFSGVAQ